MSDSLNAIFTQIQTLKTNSSRVEIACAAKLGQLTSKLKAKLDKLGYVYSEEDLSHGIKTAFLQREKLKRPKIDPNDKRVKCLNGPLKDIGPFPTTTATGEPTGAERRLGDLNKWADGQMSEIINDFITEVTQLMEQLNGIGLDANVGAIMEQIPGLKGKPLNVIIEILNDYLEKGQEKKLAYDRQRAAQQKSGMSPDKPAA